MGRRKKEPKSVHREKIATAASALFMEKGIAATSMTILRKQLDTARQLCMCTLKTKKKLLVF